MTVVNRLVAVIVTTFQSDTIKCCAQGRRDFFFFWCLQERAVSFLQSSHVTSVWILVSTSSDQDGAAIEKGWMLSTPSLNRHYPCVTCETDPVFV